MKQIATRLLTESSPFFKKAQIAIASILILAFSLQKYIPAPIFADLLKYGITAIIVSSFTVKDAAILLQDGFSVQGVLNMVQAIPGQIDEIKQSLTGKVSLDEAKTVAGITDTPPAPQPVITEQPVAETDGPSALR